METTLAIRLTCIAAELLIELNKQLLPQANQEAMHNQKSSECL